MIIILVNLRIPFHQSWPTFPDLGRLIPRHVHSGHVQNICLSVSVAATGTPAEDTVRYRVRILGKIQELLQSPHSDVALGDASHDVCEGPNCELQTGKHGQDGEGLWSRQEVTRGP